MRHRCVYYKVPREHVACVCTTVRAVQKAWVRRVPGLKAEVLLRVDAGAASGPATVMEVWRWEPDAAEAAAQAPAWAELEREMAQALGQALGQAPGQEFAGPRHVEDFGAAPG